MNKTNTTYLVIIPFFNKQSQLIFDAKKNSLIKIEISKKLSLKECINNLPNDYKILNRIKMGTTTYIPITFNVNKSINNKSLKTQNLSNLKIELSSPFDKILCNAIAVFSNEFNINAKKKYKQLFFYGGSFNPLHSGHIECVRQFPYKKDLIIIPDYNPFKNRPTHTNLFFHYQNLLKKFHKFDVKIYPGFYGLEKPNPTYNWLKKIKAQKLGLVMGDDNFFLIEKWFKATSLLKKINVLYIVPRLYSLEQNLIQKNHLIKIFPHLKIFILKEHAFMNLSSTSIRKTIQRNIKK